MFSNTAISNDKLSKSTHDLEIIVLTLDLHSISLEYKSRYISYILKYNLLNT